jgi:CheY-like chemotaxis protein
MRRGGRLSDKPSRVLLAGIGRGPFEAIAPVLERQKVRIERVETPEAAVELACAQHIDLIIFDSEPNEMPLQEIVDTLRAESSASRKTSLLVMADPDNDKQALALIGNGVNRVMYLDDPEELIERQVAELLSVAPRAAVRFRTRLYTSLESGTDAIFGQTANVSVSGMLVQTPTLLEPGQRVGFEILINGGEGAVLGQAEIVRHAVKDREGVEGIGVRFLGFESGGQERLEAALGSALEEFLV